MFRHIDKDKVREMCKYLGYTIQRRTRKPCLPCREAKAKKKPIPRISDRKLSTIPNELMFLDIATIKKPKQCTTVKTLTKPNWRLIVDDMSELAFGSFFKSKNGMVEPTCELFNMWAQEKKASQCNKM